MNTQLIEEQLADRRFGRRIFHFEEVGSTNDLALSRLESGDAEDGDVFVADRQTRGRGTKERLWESGSAEGLWMSLVTTEKNRARPLPFLPAVALADLLQADLGLPAHLKWPNDVLLDKKKVAGILVEGRSGPAQAAYVIGLGLNLAQTSFPPALEKRATSVLLESRQMPDRDDVLLKLLHRLNRLDELALDLIEAFRDRSRMIGAVIRTLDDRRFRVEDLSPEGFLLVRDAEGRRQRFISSTDSEIHPDWVDDAPQFSWARPLP